MADRGIAEGLTDDLFAPDRHVSRAQFAVLLWRYEGRPSVASSGDFLDVPRGSDFALAVAWMARSGVTTGVSPGRFDPAGAVSRVQVIVFLHRLAGSPRVSARIPFTDVDDDAWYREALAWAVVNDIAVWTGQRPLEPRRPASRGEVAAMLHQFHLHDIDRSTQPRIGSGLAVRR